MTFIRHADGTYRLQGTRARIAESTILSAAEHILGLRLVRQGHIKTPRDAAEFLRLRIGHLPHEEFHAVWLDNRHRVLATERLFTGTLDGTAVHTREVVRRALELNAAAVIVAHNHPSGVADASASDRLITEELNNAFQLIGVRLVDHLIVSAGATVSLAERGQL